MAATSAAAVPRAPGRIPLIGHVLPLARRPLDFMQSLRHTGDFVRVDVGTLPIYFVNSAELTHELLVTKARHLDKGRFFVRARVLVGDSLPTAPSHIHKRHRRLMQPSFHQAKIAGYAATMAARARAMADAWTDGQTVQVDQELAEFSVGTLAETMFSADISRPAAEAVRVDVPILLRYALLRAVTPRLLDHLPIPANRRFNQAAKRLRTVIDDVIAASHKEGDVDYNDLLSMLLNARDADTGEKLTDREIRDELVAIMFAGTETTASTLAWTFHELAKAPEVEKKLLAEIDEVAPDGNIAFEDLPKLTYTRQVIDEIGRMHSVPLLMRRVTKPVELAGHRLEEGTELAFSLYSLHRDERLYDDPHTFDPDRWLPERREGRPREGYIPFGAGNRKCIGDGFALTEIAIAMATVLSRWRFEPLPGHTVREVASAVAHPDKLPMRVVSRRT
ncbi:cytochrome P450 [Streptomyces sp. RKND-216]|uniref:cytochrome P450 n=1 Tax=Streptomyces sp. RKND-216 TaxID=2562581 RepID=UPI00109E0651|nr:cytochrome P450 [Streptomyces sp. RKND-216]THA24074.1 cytochrome P450 [Streptomyces sp. RKND-216]